MNNEAMSYEILKIPWTLELPYSEMSKEGALEFFDWLNQNIPYRLAELNSYVKASGEDITLDFSPETLLPLGYWLKKILRIRKRTREEVRTLVESVPGWLKETIKARDTELTAESLSIAFDLAIYFSNVLMKANERIKWKMHTKAGKLDADRNQLVLTGISKAQHNPIRSMQILCFQIATGKEKPEGLRNLYDVWLSSLVRQSSVQPGKQQYNDHA